MTIQNPALTVSFVKKFDPSLRGEYPSTGKIEISFFKDQAKTQLDKKEKTFNVIIDLQYLC